KKQQLKPYYDVYMLMDPQVSKEIKKKYRKEQEKNYDPSTGVKMKYYSDSSSIEHEYEKDTLMKDFEPVTIKPQKAKLNAFNQQDNHNYPYQEDDLNIISKELVKDVENSQFIGVLGKDNILTELGKYKNQGLKIAEKLLGIYN